jgi:5,10-methylenetetrahydromethanopterin reductase
VSKLGVSLVCAEIDKLAGWVRAMEDAGIDAIGFGDSPALYPEMFVQGSIVATNSSRAMFGPRVTNPVTRHPSVMASGMSALQRLSDGRAVLGIGLGDSAVHTMGLPRASIADLEEYIRALRGLFTSGTATYRGVPISCPYAGVPVPIYVAASGSRGLRLAGRLADGVIVGLGVRPELVDHALSQIEAGAAQAGRRLDDLDIWWLMGASIAPSRPEAVEAIKTHLSAAANAAFRGSWTDKLIPADLEADVRALVQAYDFSQHELPDTGGHNISALRDEDLTAYLADRFAIAGTAEQVAGQITAAASWGADQLWLTMPLPDKLGFLASMRDQVIPLVRAADDRHIGES